MNIKIMISFILLLSFNLAQAGVYKWVDSDGKIHFGDKKPSQSKVETVKIRKIKSKETVDISELTSNSSPRRSTNVIMYSTDWCGYCKKAKKYFKANRIHFKDYDIEKSQMAYRRYKKLGKNGVPVIVVGNKVMSGFSEAGFNNIYP